MKAILSADLNWGIGCNGKLLQRVPEDMKFFMKMTTGKVVVMGRETFESLPGKQPLKDRVNIVLSKNAGYSAVFSNTSINPAINPANYITSKPTSSPASNIISSPANNLASNISNAEGLVICKSLDELFEKLKVYSSEDIFVIGGQSIYTQLLPYCSEVYITRFEKVFEADRYFPDLDRMENWEPIEESEPHNYNGMRFRFMKYINKSVLNPQ